MSRTKIQEAIIPRNWLFGRIASCMDNLTNMKSDRRFTKDEQAQINLILSMMAKLYKGKKEQSEIIKAEIRVNTKNS
jgi:hypothetical protein